MIQVGRIKNISYKKKKRISVIFKPDTIEINVN